MFYSLHTIWHLVLLAVGLAVFAAVSWQWPKLAAWLVIFLAPLYLLKIGNWPLTVLEALIWVLVGAWVVRKIKTGNKSLFTPLQFRPRIFGIPTKSGEAASLYNIGAIESVVGIEAGQAFLYEREGQILDSRFRGNDKCAAGMTKEKFSAIKKSGLFWPILLILAGVILSALFSRDIAVGLGIFKSWFLAPLLFAWVFNNIFEGDEGVKTLLAALTASAVGTALIGFVYLISGRLTFDGRLAAFYLSPNHLAMWLAPGLIVGWGLWFETKKIWQKVILFLVSCFLFLVLYFTYSYGAWLGLAVAAVFTLFYLWRLKLINWHHLFLVSCFLFLVFASIIFLQLGGSHNEKLTDLLISSRSSWQSRLMIWQSAVEILKNHWLFGIGPGLFQKYYLEYQKYFSVPYLEWAVPQPHNLFLAWWLQTGLAGFIGFIWLVVSFFKQAMLAIKHSTPTISPSPREGEKKRGWVLASATKQPLIIFSMAVMVYFLVHGLVDTTFWKNDLALLFWVVIFSLRGVFWRNNVA
ncbi:O-antigen ligase family protein [Patescibacteria group bacterium]|nr:O-antigen ligase family protein [Patescibacteria group bacterium]